MAKDFLNNYKTYDTSKGFGNAKKWKEAMRQRMNKDEAKAILNHESQMPYTILGISTHSTEAEIKKAFRQLIILWHPDKNQHRIKEAEEMSKKIIAAYTLLTAKQ